MCFEELRGVGFYKDATLKVEPRAIPPIFVCVSRITIHTAMFTTLVGIHAKRHPDIRAGYLVYDAFGVDVYKLGPGGGGFAFEPLVFQVVHPRFMAVLLKTIWPLPLGAPPEQIRGI
jgi:hypothetical protein